jgi:hypothetical protein
MPEFSLPYTTIFLWLIAWIFMEGIKGVFKKNPKLCAKDKEFIEEIHKIIAYRNGGGRPLIYHDPEIKTMLRILHDKTTTLELRQQEMRDDIKDLNH